MDEVDEQLNLMSQERDVAYRYHYGGGWHVSVTTGFKCVDLRKWYVRFGETEVKPTRTGIALRLPEWLKLKQIVEYLHREAFIFVQQFSSRFEDTNSIRRIPRNPADE